MLAQVCACVQRPRDADLAAWGRLMMNRYFAGGGDENSRISRAFDREMSHRSDGDARFFFLVHTGLVLYVRVIVPVRGVMGFSCRGRWCGGRAAFSWKLL